MAKALDFGFRAIREISRDSRFDSWRGRFFADMLSIGTLFILFYDSRSVLRHDAGIQRVRLRARQEGEE
jgi:hypothetical protein